MNRREMLDELIERLEEELDELSDAELLGLITEYENTEILGIPVDNLSLEDDEEVDEIDDEELPLTSGEWDDEAEDD